jgi:putative ABC transport system substrate-binding protein
MAFVACTPTEEPASTDDAPSITDNSGANAGDDATVPDNNNAPALVDGDFLIASLQIAAHPALDGAREGFLAGLAEEGFVVGENLTFEVFNAQGDMSNAHLMAAQIVDMSPNLILGIATGTSQALANATEDIPITITAVTSPLGAGLVESNEVPGRNVTGTTDLTPVAAQFDLIMRLFPETQNVGIMYSSSEVNSIYQADIAEAAAAALGINLERMAVAVAGDVMQAAESLAGRVDVIYTPTCNLMASSMVSIVRAAEEAGVPLIVGDSGSVENGGLITVGIDYFELGRQTGHMAAQILRGEAQPATMPIQSQAGSDTYFVNISSAAILGFDVPAEILAVATIFED